MQLLRQRPAGSPGAAFQHASQWHLLWREAELLSDQWGQLVEQGHRQCPPFDDQLVAGRMHAVGSGRVFVPQYARVQKKPAVAVFGQAGQRIQASHLDAGLFKGLQQRIGQPLRQLVKRHPARAGVARCTVIERGMPPAIAECYVFNSVLRRPDAGQAG